MLDPPEGLIEKILGAIEGTGVGFLVQKPKSIKEFLIRGVACLTTGVVLGDTVNVWWEINSWMASAFIVALVFWPLIGLIYNPNTILEIIRLVLKK